MSVRKGGFSSFGRSALLASVAAMALAAIEPSVAMAGSATPTTGLSTGHGTSGNTDISVAAIAPIVPTIPAKAAMAAAPPP